MKLVSIKKGEKIMKDEELLYEMVVNNKSIHSGANKDSTTEAEISKTVDLTANVTKVVIEVKTAIADVQMVAETHLGVTLKELLIKPSNQPAALDLLGEDLGRIMKSKYPGTHFQIVTGVGLAMTEVFEFSWTDYMGELGLSLPASAKSLEIKAVFEAPGVINGANDKNVTVDATIRIVQDKGAQSKGYRRYFAQNVTITEVAGDWQEIDLPRTGLFDSFIMKETTCVISDIEILKNGEKYPLKTTAELERALAQLHNDEVFDSGITYVDLSRPIMAEDANQLKLRLKLATGGGSVRLIYEYVKMN
jgi:hypothetical protein